jgi:glycosyltransferase involved in cell wall biosynthesis
VTVHGIFFLIKKETRLTLIYLGTRGGGLKFLEDVANWYYDNNIQVDIVISERVSPKFNSEVFKFSYSDLCRIKKLKSTYTNFLKNKTSVVLMIHPLDYVFYLMCRLTRNRIITVVHDATPHPGDVWPFRRSIATRVKKSDAVIALSNYVGRMLKASHKTVIVSTLGTSDVKELLNECLDSEPPFSLPGEYVISIGRGKKYQNRELLLEAWTLAGLTDKNLLIVGGKAIKVDDVVNAYNFPGWIDDINFLKLISKAKLLVLSYSEASQSGLIPIAACLRVPVLVTDVGGLKEQIYPGVTGLIVQPSPVAISKGIIEAMEIEVPKNMHEDMKNFCMNLIELSN